MRWDLTVNGTCFKDSSMFLLINGQNNITRYSEVHTAEYLLRSLMDVSSIPPSAAWENLQKQIQLQNQNQTETISYSNLLNASIFGVIFILPCQFMCVEHLMFLPQRRWCCPSCPSLPHDASGRRVGAPAWLRPAWRGVPVMPTWSHCWVYNTEINR